MAMTITIELSPEKEAVMKAQAKARGLTIGQWLLQLADQQVQPDLDPIAHLQKSNVSLIWCRLIRGRTAVTSLASFVTI